MEHTTRFLQHPLLVLGVSQWHQVFKVGCYCYLQRLLVGESTKFYSYLGRPRLTIVGTIDVQLLAKRWLPAWVGGLQVDHNQGIRQRRGLGHLQHRLHLPDTERTFGHGHNTNLHPSLDFENISRDERGRCCLPTDLGRFIGCRAFRR